MNLQDLRGGVQEAASLSPARLRREQDGRMIITVTVTRTASQHARAVARWWEVRAGSHELVAVEWDPAGPLSAGGALRDALARLLAASDGRHVAGTPAQAYDQPLPGL